MPLIGAHAAINELEKIRWSLERVLKLKVLLEKQIKEKVVYR